MKTFKLTKSQKDAFKRDGFLLLKKFYDKKIEIEPIQRAIYNIISLVTKDHQLPIKRLPFKSTQFDTGFQELIAHNRSLGGTIYDAIKQIPAFIRLLASEKHEQLLSRLRNSSMVGVASSSYGIRIDNPKEDQYKTPWHQDYPFHLRSTDGIVLWTPLATVTQEMGRLVLCPGSHLLGPLKIKRHDPSLMIDKKNYTLDSNNYVVTEIENIEKNYNHCSPEVEIGDLLVFDFQLIHKSGSNRANRSRWTMQMRLFNFEEPTGRQMKWAGSLAAGNDFAKVQPSLIDSAS